MNGASEDDCEDPVPESVVPDADEAEELVTAEDARDEEETVGAEETIASDDACEDNDEPVDAFDDDNDDDEEDNDKEEEAAEEDAVHAMTSHSHPPTHASSSSHSGCEHTKPHEAVTEPLPVSHSSPVDCDTIPSPQRTFVHDFVHTGPMPLRPPSSHSSPSFTVPLPHSEDTCARNRIPPATATIAKSRSKRSAERRVPAGTRSKNRTAPSSATRGHSRNRLDAVFLVG